MNTGKKTPTRSSAALPSPRARVLLVEDDPVSQAYLATVVRGMPADVDCADSLAAARTLADTQRYDLWLLDAQLPDGGGAELLAQLHARYPTVPALAHTASTEPALRTALLAAGFSEVLVKPMPAVVLQSAVQRALGLASTPATRPCAVPADSTEAAVDQLPLWDDEAAARALNFNRSHIDALRGLFLDELPQARRLIVAAARDGDPAAMGAGLHRLRASCGFVGAARLAAAVAALQQQPGSAPLLARLDATARATGGDATQPDGPGNASGAPSPSGASAGVASRSPD